MDSIKKKNTVKLLTKLADDYEIGIDEAGRGPLLGRVYAGAVIWGPSTPESELIIDSKKLSKKSRALALQWIKTNVFAWGVGWAEADEIDSINILNATKLAMDRAIDDLMTRTKLVKINLIIDGTGWDKRFNDPKLNSVCSIVKGDSKYLSIAAASIIAKEFHDEYIHQLCLTNKELNDKYDLNNNMGYGTKKHIDGIKRFGYCDLHRKTFAPLKI
jgi:ribonuclease HII